MNGHDHSLPRRDLPQLRPDADVRLIPKSRRYPHFADEYLAAHLPQQGIDYLPFKHLGGKWLRMLCDEVKPFGSESPKSTAGAC